jgi:Zn-finger nucleic acid-binding protein
MWFRRGRLDDVKDEVLPELGWLDIDTWREQADFSARRASIPCPECRGTTLTTVKEKRSAAEFSVCAACNGIWLAAGQFMYLVNALLDEANRKSAPEFIRISLQQTKEMLTDRDSFGSDWQELKTVLNLLKHRIFVQHPKLRSILAGLQKSLPL